MIDVNKIDESFFNIDCDVITTNKKVRYLNIESAFDIETSSTTIGENKVAHMYIWMFGLGENNPIIYGRTWEEFQKFIEVLCLYLGLSKDNRLVVYVHNLPYEFQFMRKYFQWESIFAIAERKAIKAVTTNGIEFRDSYILSGYSLEKTAENLQKHTIEKKVGDLDYSLERHYDTPLTNEEMGYCESDIEVLLAYVNEQIEFSGDISKIPMTNTGRVRSYVRDECYYTSKNHKKTNKGKYTRYRKLMKDLTLDSETYLQLKQAFMGGFTHSNMNHTGKTLENVTSIDFTSSYPSSMLAERYPMSTPTKVTIKNEKELIELCKTYSMLFEVKFTNIRAKLEYENYISESKCYILSGATTNNGRVYKAENLAMTLTDVDFEIVNQTYVWDSIAIQNAKRFHRGYLPRSIIESILKLYEDKTELKDVVGKEVEYMLSKGMLNSVYGMSVTDIVKDNHVYSDGWHKESVNIDDEIEKYNNSKNRFLYYAWGIWITAYSRKNLWTGIIAMGNDYVYSDTDSIKLLNYEKHLPYVEWYNNMTIHKLEMMCEHYGIDKKRLQPRNKKGAVKMLGIWDYEGTYDKFKTLGAKRYLVQEKDRFTLTVAGLSKKNGIEYMIEKCNGDSEKIFDMFNDELYIPSHRTGKLTHTYIDDAITFNSLDYLGNEREVTTESGVHLEPCEFTLSISDKYKEFLRNLRMGYIYKGDDFI